MDFLDKLYSSNYFGIGLFAVIAFLVVTFLIVLFFGKKDEKKRKLEATQNISTENSFKETSTPTPVEIPKNPEPVAPINLGSEPVKEENSQSIPLEPVTPVMPVPPVAPIKLEENDNNEYVENLTVEEPKKEVEVPVTPIIDETPKAEPVTPATPIIHEVPKKDVATPFTPIIHEEPRVTPTPIEPTKIEIPQKPVEPIIKPIEPIIKEEEPKLQINEEPVINTYYKPTEKVQTEPETIKVPNIDFDSLAKSISKELDELENDSKKYDEIKVTPIHEITKEEPEKKEVFSSVYVKEEPKVMKEEKIELPKKIELPTRKDV